MTHIFIFLPAMVQSGILLPRGRCNAYISKRRKRIILVAKFIKGLTLCECFFWEIAKPILDTHFPNLKYSAGLIGYGSDVLGFDDETSTDHMWGPRFYLLLQDCDLEKRADILEVFSKTLPYTYKGFSVNFSVPDPNDNGVRHMQLIAEGPVSPLIFIHSLNEYLDEYLGLHDLEHLTPADWLSFSEHRLLALTAGKIFHDDLRIQDRLHQIRFYPEEVRLYLIASNWSLIAEEQAFVKRCADVGDEIGSILVCARIAERLMRLAFLYCGRYAPYSKWFGKAFSLLPMDEHIRSALCQAVKAPSISGREANLVLAQKLMADWHSTLKCTKPVEVRIEPYFGRNIQVIYADKIAAAAQEALADSSLSQMPLVGSISEVANFTALFDEPQYRSKVKALFE